jgi:hypothetical protein
VSAVVVLISISIATAVSSCRASSPSMNSILITYSSCPLDAQIAIESKTPCQIRVSIFFVIKIRMEKIRVHMIPEPT